MLQSLSNLVNSIIGAGVLALPSALKNTGYILGPVLLVIFAFLSSFSLLILDKLTRTTNVHTYDGLSNNIFTPSNVVDFTQAMYVVKAN